MAADRTPNELADRLDEHAAYDLLTPEDLDTLRAAAALLREQAERLQDSWYTDIGERLDAVTAERNEARRQMQSLTEDYVAMEARAVKAEATLREQAEQLDIQTALATNYAGKAVEYKQEKERAEEQLDTLRNEVLRHRRMVEGCELVHPLPTLIEQVNGDLWAAAGGGVPEIKKDKK